MIESLTRGARCGYPLRGTEGSPPTAMLHLSPKVASHKEKLHQVMCRSSADGPMNMIMTST
jgi:hypothetical protein